MLPESGLISANGETTVPTRWKRGSSAGRVSKYCECSVNLDFLKYSNLNDHI